MLTDYINMLAARVILNVPRLVANNPIKINATRWMSSEKGTRLGHIARRRSVKEMASAPTSGLANFTLVFFSI